MLALRRPTKRLIPITAAGALALAAVLVPAAASAGEPTRAGGGALPAAVEDQVVIDLVGINDFHGRLEQSAPIAGAAVLAGAVYDFEDANPNTLFVSAGDNIGATTFTSFIQQDQPTIDVLNAIGLDVAAFGNHEFDKGRADVDDRVLGAVDWPYLAANLYDTTSGEPAYDEYYVETVDGVDVGFIGAITELLPELVSPAGIETLEVRDLVDEVNRVADDLTDGDDANGEADVLVVLLHDGPDTADVAGVTGDGAFAQIVAGLSDEVDAVFTGHTHQRFAHLVERDGAVALPVVGSGQYGEGIAHVQLTVDPTQGGVVDVDAAAIALMTGSNPAVGVYPADEVIAGMVADAVAAAAGPGSVSLGEITEPLRRAFNANGTTENRGGESTLGNLVADVQRWATADKGTEIAFMNPGGLRADLAYDSSGEGDPDGNVTYKEAANVQPFANTLVTLDLTGAAIVQVLEEQWQPDDAGRPFLKLGVSGLTYTYDPEAPKGERITEVWVGDEPLDLAAEYTVAANSFLASGGDNFAAFTTGTNKADSGQVDLEAFVAYFDAMTPISPDLAQRSVGIHLANLPASGYAPGDSVVVDLSSLLFSGDVSGQPEEVTLSIGDAEVASEAIDATLSPEDTDTKDEVGRASVTFDLPADAAGDVLVDVVAGETATSFVVPVAAGFADVTPSHPFYDEILWMASSGISQGYADGTFRSTSAVNRDAMAAFLYRLVNGSEAAPACTTAPFSDVPTSHPFCGEIAWLAEEGITQGYADGTYRPAAPVRRDAMAAFVYRVVEGPDPASACTAKPFTDVPTSQPFCGEIAWLAENDLSNGWPDGTYRPGLTIERQAMAAFLFRLDDGGFLDPR